MDVYVLVRLDGCVGMGRLGRCVALGETGWLCRSW